jgi:hypothetical protein
MAGAVLALLLPSAARADASSASPGPGSWQQSWWASPGHTLAARNRPDRLAAPRTGPAVRFRSAWGSPQAYLLLAAVITHDGIRSGVAAPAAAAASATRPSAPALPRATASARLQPSARPRATTAGTTPPRAVSSTVKSAVSGPVTLPRRSDSPAALALVGPLDSQGMGIPWLVGGACAALTVLAGVLRAALQSRRRTPAPR